MIRPPVNFLILTLGSHGDVHPFVGIGAALRRRGHDVTLITNGYFEKVARREGLNFVELGTAEEYLKLTENPDLWSKSRGFKTVFGSVVDMIERGYEPVARHVQAHPDTIVIGSSLALAARVAKDKFGFPMMTVHLQPGIFRSNIAPPRVPRLFMPAWFPDWIKNTTWWIGDTLVIDPLVAPRLNALRAKLGLPPVKNVLRDWWNSPDLLVGMFPDWFAQKQPDWWPQTKLTGFPLYDERGHEPLSSELEDFLDEGSAPVAFTPGSAMRFGHRFFAAGAEACRRLGRRAILLTRHPEQIPKSIPTGVIHVDYAPFSELLPRCAALVHHGGIGTMSQALRAGVPQLVMPLTHDQPDNAMRVRRLGVGNELTPFRFRAGNVAKTLSRLLEDPAVASACRAVRERFTGVDGIEMTCDLAESLAGPRTEINPQSLRISNQLSAQNFSPLRA